MYIVMEIQVTNQVATIVTAFDSKDQAESKYYDVLSHAAISSVPKHSAVLMTDAGASLGYKTFTHEQDE